MSISLKESLTVPAAAQQAVLIITAIEGIETTAAELASRLQLTVEIAASRAAALRLLSRRGYAAVILDQILADSDPGGSDLIWKNAGIAIPMQINFAFAGGARLEREIRGALSRREREQQLALAAAAAALDAELKNAITGFLLESRLALAEQDIPPKIENRLHALMEMANRLRERLQPTVPEGTTTVSLLAPPK
jgi:hypothetical protein